MRYLLILFLFTLPAQADDVPVSPSEFEAMVTGQTLSYATAGTTYGAEDYLANRRVRWSFLDGRCSEGEWFAEGSQVCFVYEDIPETQCWQFYLRNGRLMARFENNPLATELYEIGRMDQPLICLGPEIGV